MYRLSFGSLMPSMSTSDTPRNMNGSELDDQSFVSFSHISAFISAPSLDLQAEQHKLDQRFFTNQTQRGFRMPSLMLIDGAKQDLRLAVTTVWSCSSMFWSLAMVPYSPISSGRCSRPGQTNGR